MSSPDNFGNADTTGKTRAGRIGSRPFLSLAIGGQSLTCASGADPAYTAKYPAVFNGNPYDGKLYQLSDPPLGCGQGGGTQSYIGMLADALYEKTGGILDIIVWPFGVGGTLANQWVPNGQLWPRIPWVINAAASAGYPLRFMIWGQGESEAALNLAGPVGEGNPGWPPFWSSCITAMINGSRSVGFGGRWLINIETMTNGQICVPIQQAQLALLSREGSQWPGANLDLIGIGGRDASHTHMNTGGNLAAASLIANAIIEAL